MRLLSEFSSTFMRWHKATIEKLGGSDIIADSSSPDDLATSSIISTFENSHGESSGSDHHSDRENHSESEETDQESAESETSMINSELIVENLSSTSDESTSTNQIESHTDTHSRIFGFADTDGSGTLNITELYQKLGRWFICIFKVATFIII